MSSDASTSSAHGLERRDGAGRLPVFVVDDDAKLRLALERLVRSTGRRVESFESADDFLTRGVLDAAGTVIVDVRLPGTSGIELVARLRRKSPLRAIVISAVLDARVRLDALDAGAVTALSKPLDADVLLETLDGLDAADREIPPAPRGNGGPARGR